MLAQICAPESDSGSAEGTAAERSGPAFVASVEHLASVADTPEALADVARALLELGELARGTEIAALSVQRGRQCWRCHVALAEAHIQGGLPVEALREIETALALASHAQSGTLRHAHTLLQRIEAATSAVPNEVAVPSERTRGSIREVIQGHLSEVRACYEARLAADGTLAGRFVLSFIIERDGHVPSATVRESNLGDAAAETCVAARARTWRFAPSEETTGVNYPFVFSTGP